MDSCSEARVPSHPTSQAALTPPVLQTISNGKGTRRWASGRLGRSGPLGPENFGLASSQKVGELQA